MVREPAEQRRQNPKLGIRRIRNQVADAQRVQEQKALVTFGNGKGGEGRSD